MPSSPSSAPLSLEVIAPVGRLACSAVTCSLPFDPPNGRLTALQAVDCTFISTQLGPNANTLIIFGDCGISCIEKCRGRVLGVSPRQGGPLAVDWACTTRRIQHLWLFPTLLTNVYLRDEWYFLDTVHVHKRLGWVLEPMGLWGEVGGAGWNTPRIKSSADRRLGARRMFSFVQIQLE